MKFDDCGRREVARRLRETAPETYVGLYEAVMGRRVAPDSRWGDDARELCERLAGLVEPRVEDRPGKFRVGDRAYVAVDYPCGAQLHAGDEVEVLDVVRHGLLVSSPGGQCWYVMLNQLTHERPDSWERLEDDATQHPWYYCKQHGVDTDAASPDADLAEVVTPFARDLVRRARALAERGQ